MEWGSVADWFVGAVTALAVLVALFNDRIQSWWRTPAPTIAVEEWSLARRERVRTVALQGGQSIVIPQDPVIYCYLPVVNQQPRLLAARTRVLLCRFRRRSVVQERNTDRVLPYSVPFVWAPAALNETALDISWREAIDFGHFETQLINANSFFAPELHHAPLGEDFSVRMGESAEFWLEIDCPGLPSRRLTRVYLQWHDEVTLDEARMRDRVTIRRVTDTDTAGGRD